MHALWLASWYPNATDLYNGDFIQRHAQALSTQCPVTVIHVAKAEQGMAVHDKDVDGSFTSRTLLFKAPATPIGALNTLLSQFIRFTLYRRAFREHVNAHGMPPFIHLHVCMNAGLFALWVRTWYGIPYIVTEHYTAYIPGSLQNVYTRSRVYRWLNKRILSRAAGVTSVSRYLLNQMRALSPLQQEAVIPNTVETGLFRREHVNPLSQIPFRFIHVSTMVEHKNVKGILDALTQVKTSAWRLECVGPVHPELIAYAKKLGLENQVSWTGELRYFQVCEQLKAAHAFVLFSRFENQPCVISEALCTGLPVISSNVGGISEVIDASNGILVDEGNVPALAQALETMMEQYPHYDLEELSRKAQRIHDPKKVGKAFMAYYAKLGLAGDSLKNNR
jgi:glycosyltransferase involved in cell wall biosynthesis